MGALAPMKTPQPASTTKPVEVRVRGDAEKDNHSRRFSPSAVSIGDRASMRMLSARSCTINAIMATVDNAATSPDPTKHEERAEETYEQPLMCGWITTAVTPSTNGIRRGIGDGRFLLVVMRRELIAFTFERKVDSLHTPALRSDEPLVRTCDLYLPSRVAFPQIRA